MEETPKMSKDDYELLKTIGKGSFGKVFQVRVMKNLAYCRFVTREMVRFMQ